MKVDTNVSTSQMDQNWTRYMVMCDRKDIRQATNFQEENEVQATLVGNKALAKQYEIQNPVDRGTQSTRWILNTPVWTVHNRLVHTGITHVEGGWPKEIDCWRDEELMTRYRRKQEKSEAYVQQMRGLTRTMDHAIMQNNACNIYQNYFEDIEQHELIEQFTSKTVHVYKDYLEEKRSCTYICWSDEGNHFASAHCNIGQRRGTTTDCYIWDIEHPNSPLQKLFPPYQTRCLEYNFKDSTQMAGGLFSGQVALWDIRASGTPVETTQREASHNDVVTRVLWTSSKTTNEFLSGSTDGRILWWDTRNLSEPYDYLNLAPKDVQAREEDPRHCFGVSSVEFEPTMPNKYTVGTENGMIYSCSRKYKTPADKIQSTINAHTGPIYSVERNPLFIKNYISVGDWQTKIWTEDCKDNPIVWTKEYAVQLTCGIWSPTRCSLVFICRMDGVMDAWDVIHRLDGPVLRLKLSDAPLWSVRVHKAGKLIANGTDNGAIYLTEISDNLTFSSANDKPALSGMLEREMRRQRLLEAKIKEIKLKEKELERERMRRHLRMDNANSIEEEEKDLVADAMHQFWTKIHGRKSLKNTLKGIRMRDTGVGLLAKDKKAQKKEKR
ncbi:dynein intermediate chain 3, ciliary-like [Anopheles merus]|uniref:dynein intermediate chain 3, ciliary-like n=1 Tax=Anopheles merus TaxID=30066 RepID=UPI001BE3EEA8|nr:dynein intermediate chain 3, ciliary-like [Anopheles merus]XP_041786101.1 dynein intermediate chain 3, ciliary-like [Anopheles merus]